MMPRNPDPDRPPDVAEPSGELARQWHVPALSATILLLAAVVVALPVAIGSMVGEFRGRQGVIYDLQTGAAVDPDAAIDIENASSLNVAVIDLDEVAGSLTLAVSGNRVCAGACPAARLTFAALDDDASQRRGITPFATVSLAEGEAVFSEQVQLPVRGSPVRYPFDEYRIWLGFGAPPPQTGEAPPERPPDGASFSTLQNQLARFTMAPLEEGGPNRLTTAAARSLGIAQVHGLEFRRPAYLPIQAVLLVLLVAISSVLAVTTQPVQGLALGVGSLVLAVWGVRSVLVPSSLESVTAVDLALSGAILILLLGLAVRTALYLRQRARLRLRRPWQGVERPE